MTYQLDQKECKELQAKAQSARVAIINMLAKAGSGHPGGSMSCVDILVLLYATIMNHSPKDTAWNDTDHFHLSKGHVCPAWYAVLSQHGYFPESALATLRQFNSLLQGHPHHKTPGIDVPSGSLGQGISVACGMALAAKMDGIDHSIFTLLGDGEIQEGQVWEAAMFAAHYKLDNLCIIVDNNNLQIDGPVNEVMNPYPIDKKFEAFGAHVITVQDGHDFAQLYSAFKMREEVKGKPTVIIAKTVKGKGVSFMENNLGFHGRATTEDETATAMKELEG